MRPHSILRLLIIDGVPDYVPFATSNGKKGDLYPLRYYDGRNEPDMLVFKAEMRLSPAKFRSDWPLAARFAALALLIVLLLPATMFARTRHSVRHRQYHARQHHVSYRGHRHRARRMEARRAAHRRYELRRHRAQLRRVARLHHRTRKERRYRREETAVATIPVAMRLPATPNSSTLEPEAAAADPSANPHLSNLVVFHDAVPRRMPVALRGTHEVLVHQNIIADVEGLSRIQNATELNTMVRDGDLVALPASDGLMIDPRLPSNRRYARPWVAKFLRDLSRAHDRVFGRPLLLTSAVRTVAFQRRLSYYNGNAAPTEGDTASPHLTGEAVDLGKKGMSRREIAWMRTVLGQLQAEGKLDVEEEFHQACFHISVYKTYVPRTTPPVMLVARSEPPAAVPHLQTVSTPMEHRRRVVHAHRRYAHAHRRSAVRRRRSRHHSSMYLLAARMR